MAEPPAPFSAYRTRVREEWLDYNGHLHDASYAAVLSEANEELFGALGLSEDYRRQCDASMFTVETRITFLAECGRDDELHAVTVVAEADPRKLTLHTDLFVGERKVATGESLYLHVDTARGKVTPMPPERWRAVERLWSTQGPAPATSGVTTPYEGSGSRPWDDSAPIPAPLRLHDTTVPPDWVDYNGHMSESCFLLAFGDSADAFFRFVGIDESYRAAGHSLYTVETHLHHRREAGEGDRLSMTFRILDHDDKRIHVFHEMFDDSGALLATAEQLLVHVDTRQERSAPFSDDLRQRLDAIAAAHRSLPVPDVVGRPLGIRRR
jgi:acyl-CoA thioester hydrolase